MALHPFQTFRRHQKAFLAGLTIMCMFIFILQFGKGDALERLTTLLGGRSRHTVVAKVYGKDVTDLDLDNLRRQRELANTIISRLVGRAHQLLMRDLSDPKASALADFDMPEKALIQNVLRQSGTRQNLDGPNGEMYRQLLPTMYLTVEQRKEQVFRDHDQLQGLEQSLIARDKTSQARLVRELMSVLEVEMWRRAAPTGERLYFGGSLRTEDLLDFMLWKQQADNLGISFTQEDIRAEVNRESFDHEPLEADATQALTHVQRMFNNPNPSLTIDDVYTALGDELRVCMAHVSILGYPPGVRYYRNVSLDMNHVPSVATPDEFWDYFRDNRTTMRVEMMPIKVESFLKDAAKLPQPSETDLKDFFNRYKDAEYNPDRDEPAFREPRRVAIEWISGRPESEQMRKQGDRLLAARMAGTLSNPLAPLALVGEVHNKYEDMKRRREFLLEYPPYALPRWTEPSFGLSFYRNLHTPENLTTVIGQAAGFAGTGASPLGVVSALQTAVVAREKNPSVAAQIQRETQKRTQIDATLFLATSNFWTAASLWPYAAKTEQHLPLEDVQKDVLDRIRDDLARTQVVENLKTLQTELEKLKGKPEEERKKEAEKIVAKAIKEYGLSHGASKQTDDMYHIADDEGLKALKDSYLVNPPSDDPRGRNFGSLFFDLAPPFTPERWPQERGQFGMLMDRWSSATEPFLFWKTEDKKAYTPSFEEARPKVEQAWRYKNARELARTEANKICDEVRQHKSKGDGLTWMREVSAKHSEWGEMFALYGIARLVPDLRRVGSQEYVPYLASTLKPDDSKIALRPRFVDQLMASLKEVGDATVVLNRPDSIYYVTLLTDIHRPTEEEFYRNYSTRFGLGDTLWQNMDAERRQRYRAAALEQLRSEAGAPNGKWQIDPDVRKRIEGRETGSEE
jgi:hypothetical protein